ncbi:MAG: hypothetical protein ACRDL4_21720 [Thermoleophilaceae bacterium]
MAIARTSAASSASGSSGRSARAEGGASRKHFLTPRLLRDWLRVFSELVPGRGETEAELPVGSAACC